MRARILNSENRKWWTLGAVAFSLFMIMLDNTVVNVALPAIQRGLGAGLSELEWVVNAYALTFAVLMLSGGKLADHFGRRRVFLSGLALFTAMSLACGLATTSGQLIAFRALQGAGAALMLPATLAIISAAFPPRQRGTAFGIWAGVSAMALAIGPLVGGLLTQHIDWSWIFFINVPVGTLGVLVGRIVISETRDTSRVQSLDLPGLLVSGGALFALTFGLVEANNYGWTSATILGLFGAAAAGLVLFIWIEMRRRAPMLDLSLFRSATFAGANIVAFLVTLAMFGVFFFMSLFVQQILGYSPVQAGAIFLPMTLLIMVIAPIAGRLSDRVGSRWLMAGGLLLLSGSLVLFSRLDGNAGFWDLVPGLIIGGVGMATVMTPMTAAAMGSVPVDKAGVSSGVLNTFRQIGGALGIAMMGAILTSRQNDALASGASRPEAFVDGFQIALLVGAIITVTGSIVAALLIRRVRHAPAGAEAAASATLQTAGADAGKGSA
jgi:EmrB/QacA subfamily drug resistance transporter